MLWKGQVVRSYDAPQLEVCDLETGEILRLVCVYASEKCLQREYVMSRMRAQVRHFAQFVLKFRNFRRGTSPGLDELVRWYADLYDLRSDNVRRYVGTLKDVGFVESENLLSPLFQLSSANMWSSEFLGEECASTGLYSVMRLKKDHLLEQRAEFIGEKERDWSYFQPSISCLPEPPVSGDSSASTSEATCVRLRRPIRSRLRACRRVWSLRSGEDRGIGYSRSQP
jgi:hypothetical protein